MVLERHPGPWPQHPAGQLGHDIFFRSLYIYNILELYIIIILIVYTHLYFAGDVYDMTMFAIRCFTLQNYDGCQVDHPGASRASRRVLLRN